MLIASQYCAQVANGPRVPGGQSSFFWLCSFDSDPPSFSWAKLSGGKRSGADEKHNASATACIGRVQRPWLECRDLLARMGKGKKIVRLSLMQPHISSGNRACCASRRQVHPFLSWHPSSLASLAPTVGVQEKVNTSNRICRVFMHLAIASAPHGRQGLGPASSAELLGICRFLSCM